MLADIYEELITSKYLSGVECELGAEFLERHSAPPRMVFVPAGDSFVYGDNGRRNTSDKLTKVVGTRVARLRVRIFAKSDTDTATADIRETENMIRRLVNAMHEKATGDFVLDSGEWVAEEGAEVLQYGRAYDLTASFNIPLFQDTVLEGYTTVGPPLYHTDAGSIKDFGDEGND